MKAGSLANPEGNAGRWSPRRGSADRGDVDGCLGLGGQCSRWWPVPELAVAGGHPLSQSNGVAQECHELGDTGGQSAIAMELSRWKECPVSIDGNEITSFDAAIQFGCGFAE